MDVIRIPHGKNDCDYHEDPFQVVPEHEARFRPEQQEGIERKAKREYNSPYRGDDIIYMHKGSALGTLGFPPSREYWRVKGKWNSIVAQQTTVRSNIESTEM